MIYKDEKQFWRQTVKCDLCSIVYRITIWQMTRKIRAKNFWTKFFLSRSMKIEKYLLTLSCLLFHLVDQMTAVSFSNLMNSLRCNFALDHNSIKTIKSKRNESIRFSIRCSLHCSIHSICSIQMWSFFCKCRYVCSIHS